MTRTLLYEAQKSILPNYAYHGIYYYFNLHSAKLFAGQKVNTGLPYSQILRHLQQKDVHKEPSTVLSIAVSPIYTGQLFTTPFGNPITSIQLLTHTKVYP